MSTFADSINHDDADAIIARALAELQAKNDAAAKLWGLGSRERWDADLEAGTIRFSGDGKPTVTAPVQVVGTFATSDNTFLWGWDHPSVSERLARDARLAREFGMRHGLEDFTTRKIECTLEDAWRFTAVACHLAKAQGAYRGPAGVAFVFMTFGELAFTPAR